MKTSKPKSKQNEKGKNRIIGFVFIALIIFLGIFFISKNFNPQKKSFQKIESAIDPTLMPENNSTDKKSRTLKFKIAEKQDISYSNTPRMVYRIILDVNSIPTEEEMKNTAIAIWEDGNKTWKEFTVFMYLPEMNTDLTAFGMAEFSDKAFVEFEKYEYALYGTKWEIKEPEQEKEQVPVAKMKEYTIDLSIVKVNDKEIKISVKTDFPDGTNFLLSVGRTHFLKGTDDKYSGDIFDKDFSVSQGKIETNVTVDDSEWYNEHQRLVKALPNDIKPIAKISDNITVGILYSAARDQTNEVKRILGNRGEYVTGKGVDHFGTGTAGRITTFRVEKDISFPFQK